MARDFDTADGYIGSLHAEVRDILQEIRRRCHTAVPDSGEVISYGIPAITLAGKCVVCFAAWAMYRSIRCLPATRTSANLLPPTVQPKGR